MLAESADRILATIPDDAVVLDIGAWGKPFRRADWVLDRMPFETRGLYGFDGPEPERFDASRWIQRDICDRQPFPFADDEIDFVICSHVLEDIRDPLWVCSEIARIGKAGYIEVPSRLEEQTFGIQGPWVGWGHHHWLVDLAGDELRFFFKHHILHGKPKAQFAAGFCDDLSAAERVQPFWWTGSFTAVEVAFEDFHETDDYLEGFVARELAARGLPPQPDSIASPSQSRGAARRRPAFLRR